MNVSNIKETKINGMSLNNWKWNYLHENITSSTAKATSKNNVAPNHTKSSNDSGNESGTGHSFYTDFDEFTNSLMRKEMSDYSCLDIKETDLLESDSESVKTVEIIKETSLIGESDDDDDMIRETDLIGCTDDEFTDVSSLSSLTISNGHSLNRLDGSFLSLSRDVLGSKSDLFTTNKDLMSLNDSRELEDDIDDDDDDDDELEEGGGVKRNDVDSSRKTKSPMLKFQDLESDYFETDCETMDSGIFPHKETEYFQDIGSDFFDDEEDDDLENGTMSTQQLRPKSVKLQKKKTKDGDEEDGKLTPSLSLSPVSPLPPGKTATMSNSLLRSTISELERALGDSNKLLAKRDAKMQIIRSRNIELKKTLSKEVESNTKMKHMLIEKDKIILENQTKIIALNQEISDINEKLAKFRLTRNSTSEISQKLGASSERINEGFNYSFPARSNSNNSVVESGLVEKPCGTPVSDVMSPTTGEGHRRSSTACKRRTSSTTEEQDSNNKLTPVEYFPHNNLECSNNKPNTDNLKRISREEPPNTEKKDEEKVSSNELQANLRIKFLRDAFFYYMIGFHPDEQINAILAILEYGDRRQDFVLEAHTMKKSGKKFNVSKVSSRGHSFVQEEFQ